MRSFTVCISGNVFGGVTSRVVRWAVVVELKETAYVLGFGEET
jgi:hypothetical protein